MTRDADLDRARRVKARHDKDLLAIPGVAGTGVGRDETGGAVIEVYLEDVPGRTVPEAIEGVPVRSIRTGPFRVEPRPG